MTASVKNKDIEILRAIAVLAVMLSHSFGNLITNIYSDSYLYNMFYGGGGVDLFFVISGFVIGQSYVSKILKSPFSQYISQTKSFLIRRAFRIYPLAWTWLFLTLLATYFFNTSGVFGSIDANIDATIAGIFQFANYRFQHTFMQSEYGASFVYWSLSLEEQFYIILPIMVIALRRYVLLALCFLLIYKLTITTNYFAFRYEGLLLGVLLSQAINTGWYTSLKNIISTLPTIYLSLICYGCIIGVSLVLGEFAEYLDLTKFKLAAILSLVVVALAALDIDLLIRWKSLQNIFIWIGTRSFALYLCHIPAFFICRELCYLMTGKQQPTDNFTLWFFCLGVSLAFIFAHCSYKFIETPMRQIGIGLTHRS
jgi:peptidoglycan/LPS O-acetylase OafA/YrhL